MLIIFILAAEILIPKKEKIIKNLIAFINLLTYPQATISIVIVTFFVNIEIQLSLCFFYYMYF